MTEIKPQRININVPTAELTPSFIGMPWFDEANSILRVDLVGAGSEADFAAVIPQHTSTGEHGPKVTITQTTADNALEIIQNFGAAAVTIAGGSTGSGTGLAITSASNISGAIDIVMNGNADIFSITANGSGRPLVIDTDTFVITSGGSVGIGTDAPGEKLNVVGGNMLLDNSRGYRFKDNVGTKFTALSCTTANNVQVVTPSSGGALQLIANHAGGIIQFLTGLQENMRLNPAGNLGIGAPSPSARLDLVQDTNSFALHIQKSDTGNSDCVRIENEGTGHGMLIAQEGDGAAAQITQIGSSTFALQVSQVHTGSAVAVAIANNGTGPGLQVTQDGNALNAVTIQNNGTGNDIRGSGSTWSIDKLGNATFNDVDVDGALSLNGALSVDAINVGGTVETVFLWGAVNSNGTIKDVGSGGWSSVRLGLGLYEITFSTAFTANPSVTMVIESAFGGRGIVFPDPGFPSGRVPDTTGFRTFPFAGGSAFDEDHWFVVMGRRDA